MKTLPRMSILIAVRNEGAYLARTLEGICDQLDTVVDFETLVIDGGSSDNTREVINQFIDRLPGLRLLPNPQILAASGWNIGLAEAKAPVVSILSGHAKLPKGYLAHMLKILTSMRAGVGVKAVPVGVDDKSQLIAQAFSSPLGNGGASFMANRVAGPVESIAFGCYWKDTLKEIGGFDEVINRGQDWDLNLRLRLAGYTLWLDPEMYIEYITRSDFKKLWRRQYLSGYWKYFIHRKNKQPFLPRHLIPGVFVGVLFSTVFLSLWWPYLITITVMCLLSHVITSLWQHRRLRLPLNSLLMFWWTVFIIHFSYGLGLLVGLIKPQTAGENT